MGKDRFRTDQTRYVCGNPDTDFLPNIRHVADSSEPQAERILTGLVKHRDGLNPMPLLPSAFFAFFARVSYRGLAIVLLVIVAARIIRERILRVKW
jgi:hypothetical protein